MANSLSDAFDKITALNLPAETTTEILQIIAGLAGPRERGSKLPRDWAPSESDVAYGRDLGLSLDETAEVAQRMRLWAGANSNRAIARKADWGMTFKGFLRREAEQRRERGSAFDVILDLEKRAAPSNSHNGRGAFRWAELGGNGRVRGNGRNGKAIGGGLLTFLGPADSDSSPGD